MGQIVKTLSVYNPRYGQARIRRKLGLVEGEGGPLSVVIGGANVHDTRLFGGDP